MRACYFVASAAALLAVAPSAKAVSFGDTVTCAVTGGGSFICSAASSVVDPGVEFEIGVRFPGVPLFPFFTADFSNGELLLTGLRMGSLGATILNFSNSTVPFRSVTDLGSAGWNGYSFGSDVSLASGLLVIDLRSTDFVQGSFIRLGLESVIPEPATWAMLIAGFGLVGFAARRRAAALAA